MSRNEAHYVPLPAKCFRADDLRRATRRAAFRAAMCASLFFLAGSNVSARNELTGDAVISQLREALSRYDNLEFKASGDRRSSGFDGGTNGDTLVEQEQIEFRHLGSRVFASIKSRFVDPRKETPSFSQADFVVSDDGDVLHISTEIDSSFNQIPADVARLGLILYSQRIAGTQKRDRDSILHLPIEFAAITWFVGSFRIIEYLDHANESSVTQNAEGAVLDVKGPLGKLRLSISKHYGWLPTKFEVTKGPAHRSFGGHGRTIADLYAPESIDVESIVWAGEVKEFATDKNGLWFAKDIRLTRLKKFRNRPEGRVEVETKVDELLFSPDFKEDDFRSKLLIPVGYLVTVDGAAHLPYRWDGTKAIPGVPELPAPLNRPDYQDIAKRGGGVPVQMVIAVLGIAVAVIVLRLIYLKQRA